MSTSAGIPDYRSSTGIYSDNQKRDLFSSFYEDPTASWDKIRKVFGPVKRGEIKPTVCHHLLRVLHENELLQRVYTQNVDGLERVAGLPAHLLVQCHGTLEDGKCVECGTAANLDRAFTTSSLPLCTCHGCSGFLRPNVVFFGEGLPLRFHQCQISDFEECALLIVIGTTLSVFPFASLVNQPDPLVPRLLINRERVGPFRDPDAGPNVYRDVAFVGNCDDGAKQLADCMGWDLDQPSQLADLGDLG